MEQGEAPVFVKIEDYKDVLSVFDLIKDKLEQAKGILGEIDEIKKEENAEIDLWRSTINELEQKVDEVDKVLYEPEKMW